MPFNIDSVSNGTFNSIAGDVNHVSGNLTQILNSQAVYWTAPPALYGPGGPLLLGPPNTSAGVQSTSGPIRHQSMSARARYTPYGRGQRAVGPGTDMLLEDAATSSDAVIPYEHIPGSDGNISAHNFPLSGDSGYRLSGEGFPTTHNHVTGNMTQVTSYGESEQLPEPAVHKGTRTSILEILSNWSTDERPESTLLWLRGPAGMGKSAVAQTFAACCRLGASFFFRRGHPERGSWHRLFTTIAYQLAQLIPELGVPIQRAVELNKLFVHQSRKLQFQRLVMEPLQQAQISGPVPILVLDGLDECEDEKIQQDILRLLIDAIRARQLPMRILGHSREPATVDIVRSLELAPDQKAYDDICAYLRDEFSRIRSETLARGEKMDRIWPLPHVLESLVRRSSATFIYAATIIRFVDDRYEDPRERLQSVLDLDPESTAPLDDLYTQILSTLRRERPRGDTSTTTSAKHSQHLRILHNIWRTTQPGDKSRLDLEQIDMLLDLPQGVSRRTLCRLHSLLDVPPIATPFISHRRIIWVIHAVPKGEMW
ncbi:hypothetical protein B0H16DRAFT_1462018 [Mycena metata]|uniref:Nephrocystin 3-like N-terminal domain-containing protein n=1 Tax=Mycena metata TaxID=1033252 RepID=A0AAD7IP82_9AGAR|nr:hypothetical protein B0H16DRAFT_1462018 [Mycena metata]